MKRSIDIFFSVLLLIIFCPLFIFLAFVIKFTSNDSILFWSDRVGKDNVIFKMPKFRTMKSDAPIIASHLFLDSSKHITSIGSFLRKSSLDELPQLWSILIGDMSFVGPRPALFNQHDLLSLRMQNKIHELVPGLTGWAQINGRDELPISEKVKFEIDYYNKMSFWFDLKIIFLTVAKVFFRSGISH